LLDFMIATAASDPHDALSLKCRCKSLGAHKHPLGQSTTYSVGCSAQERSGLSNQGS